MEPIKPSELQLMAQVQVLEMLVVELAKELQRIQPSFAARLRQGSSNPWEGLSIPGHPEAADMLTAELQDAWSKLLQKALLPAP